MHTLAPPSSITSLSSDKFIALMKEKGIQYPKKHGFWYKYSTPKGDFILDTWNSQTRFYPLPEGATPSGKDTSGGIVCWYGESCSVKPEEFVPSH